VREVYEGLKDRARWLVSLAGLARLSGRKRWWAIGAAVFVVVVGGALFATWDDIMRTVLDPKEPFQTYEPPPAPNYARASAWALNPVALDQHLMTGPVDVFFIHPTTFNGGRNWNGPIDDGAARRQLDRIMLPNYAGPFARVGRIFAPRYRQASLYAHMTLREDARDARRFAYGDIQAAFRFYMSHYNFGRPFIVVGVEQGGLIADRLVREEIAPNPLLAHDFVVGYMIDAIVPRDGYDAPGKTIPACRQRAQARCVVAWMAVPEADPKRARVLLSRAMAWTPDHLLENLDDRPALCVNPLLGAETDAKAPAKLNLGAANASELEWGVRAAFMPRQVSARCEDGILRISEPRSGSLRPAANWPDKLKAPPYNLFFADLEADAMKRVATFYGRADFPPGAPPIEQSMPVQSAPVHSVD
jgi:hypothetical protein